MKIRSLILSLTVLFGLQSFAQMDQPLPKDPAVRYGKLDNGLTYYIRHNELPKNRADFYIAQRVGSILENEDQRGLAHFLEHMCFNGTKNFPGNQIINYLEKNGVAFGGDLNAYTGFDETVYNIANVPTNRPELVDSCMLILHDWSGFVSLEGEEIDKERGVIHEEWRTRNSAIMRIYDQVLPKLYPDSSRYAYRMPIGLMEVVDNFPHQVLRDYYHKWYRPDLQGIIIVGDIDVDKIENRLKEMWADVPAPVDPAKRVYYTISDTKEPAVAVGTDKEFPANVLMFGYKTDPLPDQMKESAMGLVMKYMVDLVSLMMNERLKDVAEQPNAPFMEGDADYSNYLISSTKDAFQFSAQYKDNEWRRAIESLVTEARRAQLYGFTDEEYDRAKKNIESRLDNRLKSKDDRKNSQLVQECLQNFLHHEPMPGIEVEKMMIDQISPALPLDQINQVAKELITEENLFITVFAPVKEGLINPTEAELLEAYNAAWNADIKPLESATIDRPLIEKEPKAGKIVKTEANDRLGAKVLTLSNGAKVWLVKSDYKKDEILFRAYSKGGTSLFADKDYYNFRELVDVAEAGGTGTFAPKDLRKALAGKTVRLRAAIDETDETLFGNCAVKDLEPLMQLIYLNFQTPRKDAELFNTWKENGLENYRGSKADPMTAFRDSMQVALYDLTPRFRLPSEADYTEVNYDRAMKLYTERFSNAADWQYVFVGNFDEATLLPYIEKYIASIPGKKGKAENYNLANVRCFSKKSVDNEFEIAMGTAKTTVLYDIVADIPYTSNNAIAASILNSCLDYVYTSEIREKESGTYGVQAFCLLDRIPANEAMLFIMFDTNREQSRHLTDLALKLLKQIADEGPTAEHFAKATEYLKKQYDNRKVENTFKANNILTFLKYGTFDDLDYPADLANVKPADVQRIAKMFYNSAYQKKVVMDGVEKK